MNPSPGFRSHSKWKYLAPFRNLDEPHLNPLIGGDARDFSLVKNDGPFLSLKDAGNGIDRGRLSCPVAAQEADYFLFLDVKRNLPQDLHLTVGHVNVDDL